MRGQYYVNCEAVFSPKEHGHVGAFAGELLDVRWVEISLSRANLDQVVGKQTAKQR
jgi:hypothetical protein